MGRVWNGYCQRIDDRCEEVDAVPRYDDLGDVPQRVERGD